MADISVLAAWDHTKGHLAVLKDKEALKHYRYKSVEKLLENTGDLLDMVDHHCKHQVPRLEILNAYYINENVGIWRRPRRRNPKKSDVRISHSFAQYITDFFVGYMLGVPANVEYKDPIINDALKAFQEANDIDSFNSELETSLSKYGRAYEMQYRTVDGVDVVKEASVFNTFLVYDKTIEKNDIFGVYYVEDDGKYTIEIHTADEVIYFKETDLSSKDLTIEKREFHDREEVDITEYVNDGNRLGDYERQIELMDAYDFTQSDLANFMNDINEAKLIVKGNLSDDIMDADEGDVAEGMKDGDMMTIRAANNPSGTPGTVEVDYLTRSYDVAGSEAFKTRLENNIHKFSYAPNFDDVSFTNTSSGVAIQLKLYLSNQKVRSKEHLFKKGLRKRYRMWARYKEWQEELTGFDPKSLKVTMHSNLPVSFKDEIEAHINAGGKLSQETLLAQLSIVDNVDTEKQRIADEATPQTVSTKPDPNSSTSPVVDAPTL